MLALSFSASESQEQLLLLLQTSKQQLWFLLTVDIVQSINLATFILEEFPQIQ